MSDERSVWLVGGPDAGKSNYLFRTWLAIRAQRGLLVSAGLPDDVEYLNTGSAELTSGKFASHTSLGTHIQNVIPVRTRDIEPPITGALVIPDYSGEDWLAIYTNRRWSADWESRIPSLSGCLIFLRAGSSHVISPLDWMQCFQVFGQPVDLNAQPAAAEYHSPTQVVIIDWLQCVREAIREQAIQGNRLRVGIVISAWDLVPQEQQQELPSQYVHNTFPLLSQFVESNERDFEFATFGVSIAGADFIRSEGFLQQYLSGIATDFGYVVHEFGGLTRSPDHTLPIAWALGVSMHAQRITRNARGGH
jgi:hypothetical protein